MAESVFLTLQCCQAQVKTRRINPVTKHQEPYLSGWSRAGRLTFTTSFVVFLVRYNRIVIHQYNKLLLVDDRVHGGVVHHLVQNDAVEMGLSVRTIIII